MMDDVPNVNNAWKEWWFGAIRMTIVALVTTFFVVIGLYIAFRGQSQQEQEIARELAVVQAQARDANLAIACVLALPVDPVTGRNNQDVRFCFTQYGLEPPLLHHDEGQ